MRCKFNHFHPPEPLKAATGNRTQPWGPRPYHCSDCHWVINAEAGSQNWVEYLDAATARAAGHPRACKVCFPKAESKAGRRSQPTSSPSSDGPHRKRPSAYELKAIKAIHEWKNPQMGPSEKAWKAINYPLSKATKALKNIPGAQWTIDKGTPAVEWVLQKTVGGLVTLLNDGAQWSVRPKAIYSEFAKLGNDVKSRKDIFDLDLEQVDCALGWLDAKYKVLAAAEGGTTGAAGLPGIPVDIVAIVSLNLRAIGEYATYCGFDISAQPERLFTMNVLALASSPSDGAKQAALAQLVRIAKDVAAKKAWKEIEKHSFVNIVKKIAASLGQRLTKAKLAQIIPYLGAVFGAGFNSYFTAKVCDAAFFLYRERFLAEKYGPKIIEETVKPAQDFDSDNDNEV